jgi:ATP-dependent DNA helicase RecG
MRTRVIAEDEVIALSAKEESHFYDRKAKQVKSAKVQKIAVAFANADGGEFIIGIADDSDEPDPSKRWEGAKDLEELNAHLQTLFSVTPALDVRYEILKCDKRVGPPLLLSWPCAPRVVLLRAGESKRRATPHRPSEFFGQSLETGELRTGMRFRK